MKTNGIRQIVTGNKNNAYFVAIYHQFCNMKGHLGTHISVRVITYQHTGHCVTVPDYAVFT